MVHWQQVENEPQECTVGSQLEPVTCTFTTEFGGEYRITATIEDSEGRANQSEFTRWVSGGSRPASPQCRAGRSHAHPRQGELSAWGYSGNPDPVALYPCAGPGYPQPQRHHRHRILPASPKAPTRCVFRSARNISPISMSMSIWSGEAPRTDDDGEADCPMCQPRPAYAIRRTQSDRAAPEPHR